MSSITIVTVIPDFQGTYQQLALIILHFPYLKNSVFKKNRPGTIPELMQAIRITDNCNLIDVPTLRRSFENMKPREQRYVEAEGRHF
jgi:hypothetical protein